MSFALSLSPQNHVFKDYPYESFRTWGGPSTQYGRHTGNPQPCGGSLPSESRLRTDQPIASRQNRSDPCSTLHSSVQSSAQLPSCMVTPKIGARSHEPTLHSSETQPFVPQVRAGDTGTHSLTLESQSQAPRLPLFLRDSAFTDNVSFTEKKSHSNPLPNDGIADTAISIAPGAFSRWLSILRRKTERGPSKMSQYRQLFSEFSNAQTKESLVEHNPRDNEFRRSMSQKSSSDFVHAAARSTTMTIAGTSLATQSMIGSCFRVKSWGTSGSARTSYESSRCNSDPISDCLSYARAMQRGKVLEEIVRSEESYVADLKVLVNVRSEKAKVKLAAQLIYYQTYFNLLASVSSLSISTRASVRRNVTEILHMHECLLAGLHKIVPLSESMQSSVGDALSFHRCGHGRYYSVDGTNECRKPSKVRSQFRSSLDGNLSAQKYLPNSANDPKIAAAVARLFESFLGQFFAYQEYGATYEMLVRDLAATHRSLSFGHDFQSGVEILARSLESVNTRGAHLKKSLTFGDLVIKPFQRVCKYPLLFADLSKQTPVIDDPDAHLELENIVIRLKETASEINSAKANSKIQSLIAKTRLLQDCLKFSDSKPTPIAIAHFLGHVHLCGVLHIAYQTSTGFEGQYMLCALFKFYMILAIAEKGCDIYNVVSVIPLVNATVVSTDNGAGLQCHTAPFSWKLIFDLNDRLFELILSACSATEETQWKTYIHERSCIESSSLTNADSVDICRWASMRLDLKPVGVLRGQTHNLARRKSIQRAATVAAKLPLRHVIIRNTSSLYPSRSNTSEIPSCLNRSQSVGSPGYIPILAPRRSERMELEAAMFDIWTKDLLPYPGMKPADNVFKASASHVMRKLSIASITSTLSRRTSSLVNFTKSDSRDATQVDLSSNFSIKPASNRSATQSRSRVEPQNSFNVVPNKAVNFHETPERFLPPDFELKQPSRRHKATNHKAKTETLHQGLFMPLSQSVALPAATIATENLQRSVIAENVQQATRTNTKPQTAVNEATTRAKEDIYPTENSVYRPKENVPHHGRPPLARHLRRLFN